MPSLRLSGLAEGPFFSARELARARSFSRGEDGIWLAATLARLALLALLAWLLPPRIRRLRLGPLRVAAVTTVLLVAAVWLVTLPFALADLWWQHHWGLGPFHAGAWLESQPAAVGPEAAAVVGGAVLVVALARRTRRWWLVAAPVVVAVAALFALAWGWLGEVGTHPLRDPALAADATRIARIERVPGTPVRVEDVGSRTRQVNAFTNGFGPSASVVLWSTVLDGRLSRPELDVLLGHELGHVRSRHVLKAIGWVALATAPVLWLLARATRRRGGVGDPANLPLVFLLLAVLALLAAPAVDAVSRRYEAEADWRALNATRDPAAATQLFQAFARTSLEDPDPGLLDYLWLENHPTVMQRIAMARAWAASAGRRSRGDPGSP